MNRLEPLVCTLRALIDIPNPSLEIQNAAEPTVMFANMCAMYLNHLEYHRRLLASLEKDVADFPDGWKLRPPIFPAPTWIPETRDKLLAVEEEVSKVHAEIKKMRQLVC